MNDQPKIKLNLSKIDFTIEIIGWTALLTGWALVVFNYSNLPEIIPTHYDELGNANGFNKKSSVFIFPIIATFLFMALTGLNKIPDQFSYFMKITNENAKTQYLYATKMLRSLKVAIAIVFTILIFKTVYPTNNTLGLGNWFLPFSLCLIFIPTTYFIIKPIVLNRKRTK